MVIGVKIMGKRNKTYKVKNLSKVNTTLYKNGDTFYTDRSIGILHKGKVKTIGDTPDLSDYAKKDEVQAMIPDVSEYVKGDEVQAMIDEAINNLGGEGSE
jgi:hypothetical protein